MVSNIRYETAPNLNFKGNKREKTKFIVLLISIIIILIIPYQSLFPLLILYILLGIFLWIFRLNKGQDILIEEEDELESKD